MGGDAEVFRAGLEAFGARARTGPAGAHPRVEVRHSRHGVAVVLDWLAAARRRRRRPPRVT